MRTHDSSEPQWPRPSLLASALSIALCGMISATAAAQPAFAPPPTPTPQASAVRGVYDPARHITSPATIAPPIPPAQQDLPGPPVTPTTPTNAKPLEGGEIVARIDGQIVLASDLLWQVNKILEANADRIPPGKREEIAQTIMQKQLMGQLDTMLLYADFRRSVPADKIPEVEKNLEQPFEEHELPRLMALFEVESPKQLQIELGKLGTSTSDMQRQFNERTIASEWLRQMTPQPKEVSYDDLVEYYQTRVKQGEYDVTAKVKWEELMVRFSKFGGDRAAAWRAIAEMGNEVWGYVAANPDLRGPVFPDIAKAKSHGFTADKGGQHKWTTQGSLRSDKIDEALFSLKLGQLSNVIETEQGFHIVRVLQREEAGRTPFTEAQADIRKKLQAERKRGLVETELKKIRERSNIWTIFDGDVPGPELAERLDQRDRR